MNRPTRLERLNSLVTEAILRAEDLEDAGDEDSRRAYLAVSGLEERIAEEMSAGDPEGAIARRGAVRALLKARDFARAQELAGRFLSETDAPDELRSDLNRLVEQARALSDNPQR